MIDGRKWEGAARFPAAQDFFTFMGHLDNLWTAMTLEYFGKSPDQMPNRMLMKKVSVILHSLEADGTITDDLFNTEIAETRQIMTKRESLSNAIAEINKKYHNEAVSLGIVPKTLAGHVGTKIAISRIPDMEEFTE